MNRTIDITKAEKLLHALQTDSRFKNDLETTLTTSMRKGWPTVAISSDLVQARLHEIGLVEKDSRLLDLHHYRKIGQLATSLSKSGVNRANHQQHHP